MFKSELEFKQLFDLNYFPLDVISIIYSFYNKKIFSEDILKSIHEDSPRNKLIEYLHANACSYSMTINHFTKTSHSIIISNLIDYCKIYNKFFNYIFKHHQHNFKLNNFINNILFSQQELNRHPYVKRYTGIYTDWIILSQKHVTQKKINWNETFKYYNNCVESILENIPKLENNFESKNFQNFMKTRDLYLFEYHCMINTELLSMLFYFSEHSRNMSIKIYELFIKLNNCIYKL